MKDAYILMRIQYDEDVVTPKELAGYVDEEFQETVNFDDGPESPVQGIHGYGVALTDLSETE